MSRKLTSGCYSKLASAKETTGAKIAQVEKFRNSEHFKFTKGIWNAEKKNENQTCHLIKTGDKYTIHVYDSKFGISEEESWANAVLASKAPELLKMLVEILKHIQDEELEEIYHFPMLRDAYILLNQACVTDDRGQK